MRSRTRRFTAVVAPLVAVALVACGGLEPPSPVDEVTAQADTASAAAQHYLVVARGNAGPAQVEAAVTAAGGRVVRSLPSVGVYTAVAADGGFVRALRSDRRIEAADPLPLARLPEVRSASVAADAAPQDAHEPLPALFDLLWGIARVGAPAAWERGVVGSHDTVVAVIDTGIAWNHPDLEDNVVFAACFTVDGSVVGFELPDDAACNPYPSLDWHGTHVAGTIAASGAVGVIGVGPSLGLASYNVFELFDLGDEIVLSAAFDSVFAAMIDAADRGFDVINLSLGALIAFGGGPGSADSAAIRAATKRVSDYVRRAGTVVVASAGNAAVDLTGPILNLPGGVPGVINVGATGIRPDPVYPQPGSSDVRAFYSNVGAPVDLVAPGGDCGPAGCDDPDAALYLILSTYVEADPGCAATASCAVGFAFAGGTSMAAPHVAGAAGLVLDQDPRLNPNQVASLLQRTADRIGPRLVFGHGMLNVDAATR